jgi:hypothetical protein
VDEGEGRYTVSQLCEGWEASYLSLRLRYEGEGSYEVSWLSYGTTCFTSVTCLVQRWRGAEAPVLLVHEG